MSNTEQDGNKKINIQNVKNGIKMTKLNVKLRFEDDLIKIKRDRLHKGQMEVLRIIQWVLMVIICGNFIQKIRQDSG